PAEVPPPRPGGPRPPAGPPAEDEQDERGRRAPLRQPEPPPEHVHPERDEDAPEEAVHRERRPRGEPDLDEARRGDRSQVVVVERRPAIPRIHPPELHSDRH